MHYNVEVLRYTNIVYVGAYLVKTYVKNCSQLFVTFKAIFCWLAICISRVSKFHSYFDMNRNSDKIYLLGILVLPLWKFQSQLSSTYLAFLKWSINCSSHFFIHFLLYSKFYELSLWFWRFPEDQTLIYI